MGKLNCFEAAGVYTSTKSEAIVTEGSRDTSLVQILISIDYTLSKKGQLTIGAVLTTVGVHVS